MKIKNALQGVTLFFGLAAMSAQGTSFEFIKNGYLNFSSKESNPTSEQIEGMIALRDLATTNCIRTPGSLMVVIDAADDPTASTQNHTLVAERLQKINDLLIQLGFARGEVFGKRTSLSSLNERLAASGDSTQSLTPHAVAVQLVCQRKFK